MCEIVFICICVIFNFIMIIIFIFKLIVVEIYIKQTKLLILNLSFFKRSKLQIKMYIVFELEHNNI